jgi:hypothetical protein
MGTFEIFENNLNGFWDFYHGTNKGSGSPKAMVYLWPLKKQNALGTG